jgi:glycosyltransferase involved in cell wall biosynthesis
MHRSVGIVVPAYKPDVERLRSYLEALETVIEPESIRVEYDVPQDPAAVDSLATSTIDVNTNPYRRGKGAAITAGFEALDTDINAFADADGSTSAHALADVLDPIVSNDADLAVGSRRHPDATIETHQTYARRWLGDGFAWIARRLLDTDLHDYQCGAKAVTAEGWRAVREHLYAAGFAWDIELVAMAAAQNLRIEEVPITWHDEPGSTVSPIRTSLSMARALFVARHRAKRVRNSRLHTAIAARKDDTEALIDRHD